MHDENGVDFIWAMGAKADRVEFRPDMDRSIREISRTEFADLYDRHASELDSSPDPVLDLGAAWQALHACPLMPAPICLSVWRGAIIRRV